MSSKAHHVLGALAALITLAGTTDAAVAQAFPTKSIRIEVGLGAGGPTDLAARLLAEKLAPLLNTSVVVENKIGASGLVAARYILSQPADGHTLLLCSHFESINSVLFKKPPYKIDELAGISQISSYYYGFSIANSVPANTFEEFIAYAKARPGQLNSATSIAQEIMMNQFEKATGISMVRIQYNSTPVILQEMLAGRAHFNGNTIAGIMPQYKAKQVKLIAVSGPQRLAEAPEVPTLKEKGIENIYASGWLGLCAHAGTPKPIIDTLNKHVRAIVGSDEYKSFLARVGSNAVSSTPEDFQKLMQQTVDQVEPTIKEFNMQQN
jgi:tripartite-type tricarboxylate transporter receptor subunit TctC